MTTSVRDAEFIPMFGKTACGQLEKRIRAVELRCEDLERAHKSLDLEWTETYDKLRKLHSRLAKRDQRARMDAGDTNGDDGGRRSEPPINPLAQRLLGFPEG